MQEREIHEKQQQRELFEELEVYGELSEGLALPHGGIPPTSQRTRSKVQPFSFHDRDQQTLKRKQEKIEQVCVSEQQSYLDLI